MIYIALRGDGTRPYRKNEGVFTFSHRLLQVLHLVGLLADTAVAAAIDTRGSL